MSRSTFTLPNLASVEETRLEINSSTLIEQTIHELREQGNRVSTCFFDLAKAFPLYGTKVSFTRPSSKEYWGFWRTGWQATYLVARRGSNVVAPCPHLSLSGVPERSILVPQLFVMYVNDLPMSVTDVSLFDDETTVTVAHP